MCSNRLIVESLPKTHAQDVLRLSRLTGGTQLDVLNEAEKPHTLIWVARIEGVEPQAYALCWRVADELQLVDLATAPTARRRGLARGLLGRLREFSLIEGLAAIWLEVRNDNRAALELYESFGFERTRTRVRYYPDGADACEMALFLNSSKRESDQR